MQEAGVLNEITRRVWARGCLLMMEFYFLNLPPKCRVDGYNFLSCKYTDGELTMIFERL